MDKPLYKDDSDDDNDTDHAAIQPLPTPVGLFWPSNNEPEIGELGDARASDVQNVRIVRSPKRKSDNQAPKKQAIDPASAINAETRNQRQNESLVEMLRRKSKFSQSPSEDPDPIDVTGLHLAAVGLFLPKFLARHPEWTPLALLQITARFIAPRLGITLAFAREELLRKLLNVTKSGRR